MKNSLIFLAIILILPLLTFSQEYEYVPFPDSGAIWSEVYYRSMNPNLTYPPPIYERFALSGEDTVMSDLTYKKLYIFYDTIFDKNNATYVGGIREDINKRVYYKGDTIHHVKPSYTQIINAGGNVGDEILLYDFSLSLGDTLKFGNLSKPDGYLIVSLIDTIKVGESYRKKYHFEPIYWVKWIEGIGNLKGLLFTSGDLPFNGLNNDLICFKQNNEILYFYEKYDDCIPLITGIEIKKNDFNPIKIFPNPVTDDIVRFDFGGTNITNIMIYDCNGIILDNYVVGLQSTFTILIEKYQPGIYFYKATNKNGIKHTGKFVVQ